MKEATGDMGMTIVVILGIAAVLILGRTVIWPAIADKLNNSMDNINYANINRTT